MNNILNKLKKNDRVLNHLALCFLYEYGRINLQDENIYSIVKIRTKKENAKNNMITDDYMFSALNIAKEMCSLSLNDLCNFVYQDVKEQKKQERNR